MSKCNGINKNGLSCKNIAKHNKYCWRHSKKSSINSYLYELPTEIFIKIYNFLHFKDQIKLSNINKKAYNIFRNLIIKNTDINLLLNKDITASYYFKKYFENNKINTFMNINYYNNIYIKEIDYRITYKNKSIIIYDNHLYENIKNKEINFGFETKELKCIDNEIETINDLLKSLNI